MKKFTNANAVILNDNNSIFSNKNRNNGNRNSNDNNGNNGNNNHNISGNNNVYARIDNDKGLFVIHPDLMISPTKIVEAIGCVRRGRCR